MSALCSPVGKPCPPSEHTRRMSPYVADGQNSAENINSNRGNEYVNITNIHQSLERTYTEDVVDSQGKDSPQSLRPISSSPEQGTQRSRGGIKLPGMTSDGVEDVKLTR